MISANNSPANTSLLWAYVQPTPEVVQQLSADALPRVKLTGTGKMPVVDMRPKSVLPNGHPAVSGLPPKSPVYALVNKNNKKKSPVKQQPVHQHNYCNVSPLLGDIINKKDEVFQQVEPHQVYASVNKKHEYENTKGVMNNITKNENYLPMGPGAFQDEDLPLKPFDPLDYRKRNHDEIDPISLRLQVLYNFPIKRWR